MSIWAQQHLTQAELLQVAGASDPASQAVLDALPAILRETLLFPYTQGLNDVARRVHVGRRLRGRRRRCSPTRPTRPSRSSTPRSSAAREAPVAGRVPRRPREAARRRLVRARSRTRWASSSCGSCSRDAAGVDSATAEAAAAGWGGDRVALHRRPGRRDAAWSSTPAGTRTPTRPSSRRPSRASSPKLQAAGRSASILTPEPESRGRRDQRELGRHHGPARERPRPGRLIGLAARLAPRATSTRAPRSRAARARSRASSSPRAPARAASPTAPAAPRPRPARRDRRRGTGSRARSRRR